MKKIIKYIIITAVVIISASVLVGAKSNGWYCIRTKDHSQPPMPPEFNYIDKYNGFYIDKSHTDMNEEEKVIYLTFDAGYENGNVAKILDVLKSNDVTGAFFILSNLVNTEPQLVQRMSDEGHLVCNHTSKHPDVTMFSSLDDFKEELDALNEDCKTKAGVNVSKYFRPPEGKFNEQTLKYASELGYKTILWSFAYADWDNSKQMTESAAKEKILSNLHNGAIILLHPTSKTNADILDEVIKEIKAQGFRFGSLDEL